MTDSIKVSKLGRTKVVRGLSWRPIQADTPAEIKSQISDVLSETDIQYGCKIEQDTMCLLGFGDRQHDADLQGCTPLAIMLTQVAENCLFIEQLGDDEYWIAGIKSGLIDTRLDLICDERQLVNKISDIALSENRQGTWDQYQIFIDVDQPIASDYLTEAKPARLDELIIDQKFKIKIGKLRGVSPQTIRTLAALIFIGIIGTAGWFGWSYYQIQIAQKNELKRAQENASNALKIQSLVDARIDQAVTDALNTDLGNAAVPKLLDRCLNLMSLYPRHQASWSLNNIQCDFGTQNKFKLQYRRKTKSGATWRRLLSVFPTPDCLRIDAQKQTADCQSDLPGGFDLRTPPVRGGLPTFNQFITGLPNQIQHKEFMPGFSGVISAHGLREIQYLDPEKEVLGETGNAAMVTVPSHQSYYQGSWTIKGQFLTVLEDLVLSDTNLNIQSLTLTPRGSALSWELKGQYFLTL